MGRVSVVMIAAAAPAQPSARSIPPSAVTPRWMASIGRCRPITPVESASTSSDAHPAIGATWAAVARVFSSPCAPVQALALPVLTITARMAASGRARMAWS